MSDFKVCDITPSVAFIDEDGYVVDEQCLEEIKEAEFNMLCKIGGSVVNCENEGQLALLFDKYYDLLNKYEENCKKSSFLRNKKEQDCMLKDAISKNSEKL